MDSKIQLKAHCQLTKDNKGHTLSGDAVFKLFYLLSEKGSALKGKNS